VQWVFFSNDWEKGALQFSVLGVIDANIIRLWDLRTGKVLREIFSPALLSFGVLSPEGRRVLTISISHEVMLWDLFTGTPLLAEPLKHDGNLNLTFSPDGEKLITHDSAKRLVHVWGSRTGQPLAEPLEDKSVGNYLFTADGQRVVLWESL